MALVIGTALVAQEPQYWVGVQGGYDFRAEQDLGLKGYGIGGATLGAWFTPRWGAELSLLASRIPFTEGAYVNEYHGHLLGVFNLYPNASPWAPYLKAGLGAATLDAPAAYGGDTTTRFSYTGGLGVQGRFRDHLLLGLEARAVRVNSYSPFTETMGLAMVGFRWGRKPVPQAAPIPMAMPEPEVLPPPRPELEHLAEPLAIAPPPPPPPPPAKIILD
jgi:opacity protein-like surface antigen